MSLSFSTTSSFEDVFPGVFDFSITVSDSHPTVSGVVYGKVRWGDNQVDEFISSDGVSHDFSHTYPSTGTYFVTVELYTKRYPSQDKSITTYPLNVISTGAAETPSPGVLRGPVSPGLPNVDEWSLDLSVDEKVLVSDLKNLLTTTRGERLMNPRFGTGLRGLVFDPIDGTDETISSEIRGAITEFFPLVSVQKIVVQRDPATRTVKVNVLFVSKLSRKPLGLSIPFFSA